MRSSVLIAAASVLALAACAPRTPPATVTGKLDCPQTSGELSRVSAAADGKSCLYRLEDGQEVQLSLLATPHGPEAALGALEAQLKAEAGMPTTKPDAAPTAPAASDEAQKVIDEAAADAKAHDAPASKPGSVTVTAKVTETQTIHAPGVVVTESKDGDHAKIDLPGIHINAADDKASVQVGPIHIDANEGVAIIKVMKDVRMRGEALSREKRGLRATFIYAGENLAGPYHYVGYEASGPRKGPLAIAIVKSSAKGSSQQDEMYDDVKRLVRRNGGA